MTVTDHREDTAASNSGFGWPSDFARVPLDDWIHQPVDAFGLNYDAVDHHSWYKNLEPTVSQLMATIRPNSLVVDYGSGTGILTRRLVTQIDHPIGILNVDASKKFLRVALENFRDDNRVAFRLLKWLKEEERLERLEEVVSPRLQERGADVLTSTNAIHLYSDLIDTLSSWKRILQPGGKVFICSANIRNPNRRAGDWIIDETVAAVNQIAADLVHRESCFAKYRDILDDPDRIAQHQMLREKVFVPVRPLAEYLEAFAHCGFKVRHVFESTIFATVSEWSELLCTYHDGALSWVGGSPKIEGAEPSPDALDDRYFLIRYSMERLFPGQSSFPCTWTYITCEA